MSTGHANMLFFEVRDGKAPSSMIDVRSLLGGAVPVVSGYHDP